MVGWLDAHPLPHNGPCSKVVSKGPNFSRNHYVVAGNHLRVQKSYPILYPFLDRTASLQRGAQAVENSSTLPYC